MEVPTLNVSLLLKASINNVRTMSPSLLFGKYAVLRVPENY